MGLACMYSHACKRTRLPNLVCSLAIITLWQWYNPVVAVTQEPRSQGIGNEHLQDLFKQTDMQAQELQQQMAQPQSVNESGMQSSGEVQQPQQGLFAMAHTSSKGAFLERQDTLPRKLIQGSSISAISSASTAQPELTQQLDSEGAGLLPSPVPADTTFVHGGIPRIIHQVFLSGKQELYQEEAKQGSCFHRDWRRSCQVHNPGWRYILWDEAMAEALLAQHYPWFLPQYRAMKERPVVIRGDAIRPFILHAYGGLYLDMDTECFGPSDVSLHGHSLVLQAELPWQVNNAQMASVRGHPFWVALQQRANDPAFYPAYMNGTHILLAAGPMAVSTLLRSYLRLLPDDNLPGAYLDSGVLDTSSAACTAAGSHCAQASNAGMTTVRVYARWEWFQACEWNKPACHAELAKCAPLVRAVLRARYITSPDYAATLLSKVPAGFRPVHDNSDLLNLMRISNGYDAPNCSAPGHVARRMSKRRVLGTGCMCRFGAVVGAHHFSGSWTKHDNAAGRSGMADKAAAGLASFFSNPSVFLEVGTTGRVPTAEIQGSLGQVDENLGSVRRGGSQTRNIGHRQRFAWISNALDVLESDSAPVSTQMQQAPQHSAVSVTSSNQAAHQEADHQDRPAAATCHLLSISQVLHPASCAEPCPFKEAEWQIRAVHDLARWANRHGCSLTLITDLPTSHPLLTGVMAMPNVVAHQAKLNLGPQDSPVQVTDEEEEEGDEDVAASDTATTDTDDIHQFQSTNGWTDGVDQAPTGSHAGSAADYGAVDQQELKDEDPVRQLQEFNLQDVSAAVAEGALHIPSKTLDQIIAEWQTQHPAGRLSMIHISCPGNGTWAALHHVHTTGSRALLEANAPVMLLDLGPVTPTSQHLLLPAYQHLYQELGYVGHYHRFLSNLVSQSQSQSPSEAWRRDVCETCCWTASICEEDVVMPAVRIGLTKQNSQQVVDWDF